MNIQQLNQELQKDLLKALFPKEEYKKKLQMLFPKHIAQIIADGREENK